MAHFDNMQRNAVMKVNKLYGDLGTWLPSVGGDPLTGYFLFKDPSEYMELSDVTFKPNHVTAEYNILDFVGLKASADQNNNEKVTITAGLNAGEYWVRMVWQKYDGKTFISVLEPVE